MLLAVQAWTSFLSFFESANSIKFLRIKIENFAKQKRLISAQFNKLYKFKINDFIVWSLVSRKRNYIYTGINKKPYIVLGL